MNTYRYTFAVACPGNGEQIIYSLELQHQDMVRVEHIKTACALHREGYQEQIAQDLHARFGGLLTLRANHHGVDIETRIAPTPAAQADSVLEDAAREAIEKVLALFPFNVPIQKFTINNGPCLTADNDDEFYSVKRVLAFLTEIKTTLDAARKQGGA